MKPKMKREEDVQWCDAGMYSGMTITMCILGVVIMRMWRNNISCFVLQTTPTWLTS